MKTNKTAVEDGLYTVRNILPSSPVSEDDRQVYWSSNENKAGNGAFQSIIYSDTGKYEWRFVRPVVKY